MTQIRNKIFGIFIAALMLAGFALPSMAASTTKSFYAKFPSVASTTMSMFIQNTSTGGGTSTINSMSVEALGGTQILGLKMTKPTGMQPTLTYPNFPDKSKVIVTNIPGISKQSNATFELTVSALNCPQGFKVAANAGNSVALNGDAFLDTNGSGYTYLVSCSIAELICPSGLDPNYPQFVQEYGDITASVERFENKDGSVCIPMASNLTFDSSARKVTILWDEALQPYAVLGSHVEWAPELALAGSPQKPPTKYSVDGINSYDAPMCLSDIPPEVYGTLTASINNAVTSFGITSSALPQPPFPIVIGASTSSPPGTRPERMLVKTVTGGPTTADPFQPYTVTVDRGRGNTPMSAHDISSRVMSTPAPISTNIAYGIVGLPAPVCLKKETFQSKDFPDASDCPPQTAAEPLKACFKVTSDFFLFGDVYMNR